MKETKQNKSRVFSAEQNDTMAKANQNAQETFGYFWRELYWEYRRIIPALNFGMVKIPFQQEVEGKEPIVEHMWINNVYFDGETIKGELINEPNELTNVKNGDWVSKKVSEISDWLFAIDDETFGGFTIQTMRSQMSDEERQAHDEAWGLDFGDYNDIMIANGQKEDPQFLIDHPMSMNMREEMQKFLRENPEEVSLVDEDGFTLLHRESIAGNKTMVEVLLEFGADKSVKSKFGKTAYDYAQQMHWKHLEDLLK